MALARAHLPKNSLKQENILGNMIRNNENQKMIRFGEQDFLMGVEYFACN